MIEMVAQVSRHELVVYETGGLTRVGSRADLEVRDTAGLEA